MDQLAPSPGLFHALRLKPGDNLVAGLRNAFVASGADAMAVVTCVGSLREVSLRHADQPVGTAYSGHFEIVSLAGTLDAAGQHLHIAIADSEGRVFGGHLLAQGSRIYTTAEVVLLTLSDLSFSRRPCPISGYRELVISQRKDKSDRQA